MTISAAQVKELRERTGSGMMECKRALVEAQGNIEIAVKLLRQAGLAQADKKAGRIAAEGRITIANSGDGNSAAMVEINSETDFVAQDANFVGFATAVARRVVDSCPADLKILADMPLQDGDDATMNDARHALIAKIGENINVRRFVEFNAGTDVLAWYLHGARIGVLVHMQGGSQQLARDVAMHIAASRPICVRPEDVPEQLVAKEKEIFAAQAEASGKPAAIVEKMVNGRIKKYLREVALLGQPFVRDANITVAKMLQDAGAKVIRFQRFELGEGIEKKTQDFAQEVMAQVQGD